MGTNGGADRAALIAADDPLFSFRVDGDPVPWARARGGEAFGGFYTPDRQRKYKRLVGEFCRVAMLQAKLRSPIALPDAVLLSIRVFITPPESWRKSKPADFDRALRGWYCTERPDCDNWTKLPMDGMNGLAYAHDAQVVGFLHSGKWWTPSRPRLEVGVWKVTAP